MIGITGVCILLGFIILLVIVICIIENENGKLREVVKQSKELVEYLKVRGDLKDE